MHTLLRLYYALTLVAHFARQLNQATMSPLRKIIMIEKTGKIALLVFLGFSTSLLLTIILISYGLYKLDESNSSVHQIVNQHNSKEHLIAKMHLAARERVLSLFSMVVIDDPFARDDFFMVFTANGGKFANARIALLKMSLDAEEQAMIDKQGEYTATAVPLQNQIIELVNQEELEQAKELLLDKGIPAQNLVLAELDKLVELQRKKTFLISDETNIESGQASLYILWLGAIAVFSGLFIAIITSIKVYRDQKKLKHLNARLESRVKERTQALAIANSELQTNIESLKHTQEQLIESEKLASLGSLVAGIAHELNTPLGVGITAISAFQQSHNDFKKLFEDNNISYEDMDEHIHTNGNFIEIIMHNLFRSTELVKRFKQVAVDQTSEQRRDFLLSEVIQNNLFTLQPKFKHSPHKIEHDIEDHITMNSFPGPLEQVITNLIINADLHAFADNEAGQIKITAHSINHEYVGINVADNGQGIPEENIKQIFDPFFTTKMGKGGSGLGMHIVYTIVTGILGGKIKLHSKLGAGTQVEMILPVNAPEST